MNAERCINKKFICVFLAFVMLATGIQVTKLHGDSFFAYSKGKNQNVTIGTIQQKIETICWGVKSYGESCKELQEKISWQKNQRTCREQYLVCPGTLLHTNTFYAFEKADTRLCRPARLMDVIIIYFITC
mgnify:CR=1 FL=1